MKKQIWLIIVFFLMLVGCTSTKYKLTLNLDGGLINMNSIQVFNEPTTIELVPPIKAGYEFLGWEYDGEMLETSTIYVDQNISLQAKWFKTSYVITLEDELNNTKTYMDVTYDKKMTLPTLTKLGYEFIGWKYEDKLYTGDKYEYQQDITLKAYWREESYIVDFMDGNKEVLSPITIKYLEEITLPTLTKDGYEFLGWYDGDTLIENGKYIYNYGMTLHSKWRPKTYNITFITNTDEKISTLRVTYNEKFILPTIQKENYVFKGWYYNELKIEDGKYLFLEDLVLEAQWEEGMIKELIDSFVVKLYNTQNLDNDEISLYKQGETINSTKYWQKYGIIQNGDQYIISKILTSGDAISEMGDYDYILLAYSNYSMYNKFCSLSVTVGDVVEFSVGLDTLVNGEVNLTVSFYKVIYPDPSVDEFIEYLDNLYQNIEEVSSDIDLVTSYLGHTIAWETSNKEVINKNGKFNKPVVTRNVTLSAYVNKKKIYDFTVLVKGEKETSDALTTGYFYTNFSDVTLETFQNLDIAYISFLYVSSEGEFASILENTTFLKSVVAKFLPLSKKTGTKIVISINQQNKEFGTIAKSDVLRKKFSENIVSLINEYGFDGIDIDWETPKSAESTYFTLMMQEIYQAVKANNPNNLVTAAIGGGKWQPPKYDLSSSVKYLDYINMMTYSMTSSNGQFHNALYKSSKGYTLTSCTIEESIAIYDSYGVPRDKIIVGLAFYGIKQFGSNGVGTKSTSNSSITYRSIYQDYLTKDLPNVDICYDEETASPYIYDKENQIFITYENELSIAKKCDYVNTLGLAGVMYWQDGQDYGDNLLNAIKENIKK